MYQLHIANKNYSSWSLRPWVAMRALDIPFEEVIHPFSDSGNRDRFRQFSPTAQVPCLVDGEHTVWDSLAIIEYLAEAWPTVWPREKTARAWARCASAEMHSGFTALRNDCSMSCGQQVDLRATSPALEQDLARIDELWSQGLEDFAGPYLAGPEFTAVDAFFAPVVFRLQSYRLPLSKRAQAYQSLMLDLPAMRQWYEEALAETWRETSHEQEVARSGSIVADYRAS